MKLDFLKNKPTKIVCVGLNYHCHAKELNMNTPHHPIIFMKPVSALNGPDGKIIYPKISKRVDYEGELGIVIKKKCRNVSKSKAKDYILGYTCVNDVTARDIQKLDGQWVRAKSFDSFCCVGPKVVKLKNPNNVKIQTFLNGKIKQDSNTKEFIFPVEKIVSFISQVMTLMPGDIIATGTPKGIGPMKKGDTIEVRIEGIGTLRNFVK